MLTAIFTGIGVAIGFRTVHTARLIGLWFTETPAERWERSEDYHRKWRAGGC
jgi:hypothetical protein